MDMQSFILPANGKATPKSIERKRKMAEAMMQSGMDTSPIASPWQAGARIAQALVGGYSQRKADQAEAEGQQSARDAMTKALMGGDKAAMLDAMNNPFMDNQSLGLVTDAWNRQFTPQTPKLVEAGGSLYDPSTGEWITPPPKPQNADARAKLGLSPQYGVDAQGNPVLLQIGDDGAAVQTQMPEGVSLSKEPIKLDAGTHFVLLDPITRQPVGTVPKDLAGAEREKKVGEQQGAAQADLPGEKLSVDYVNSQIDDVINDPDLSSIAGYASYLPPALQTNAMVRVRSKLDQLGGQAFLQARQVLKGGGAISDTESGKAEQAYSRLQAAIRASDVNEIVSALNDFKSAVNLGYQKLQARAGNVPMPNSTPQKRLRYNSATGELE